MISLAGKVALVTGGGAGIGRAIAQAFAQAGADLVVAEINENRAAALRAELELTSARALVIVGDVRRPEDVIALMTAVTSAFGQLDILINNVGGYLEITKPFSETTEDEWDRLYHNNLRHIFLVTKFAIPLLRRSAAGSIINISSIEAFRAAPDYCVYSSFKAAITQFTRTLACELGPQNIRVNAIGPEITVTERINVLAWILPKYRKHIARWFPLGRFGQPSDAAGCALFLASDLSAWVTGTTINMDGGALAAGGFYRTPGGRWTNLPVVTDRGWREPEGFGQ